MDVDAFDAAFADAIKPETATSAVAINAALATPTPPAPQVPETPPAATEASQAAETAPVVQGETETEIEVPAEGGEEHPVKPPEVSDEDMLKRFAALMAQAQPAPQPQQVTQPQPQAPPPIFSNQELGTLRKFYDDWPDVAQAAEIMARGMLQQSMRTMYQDIATSLAPYLRTVDALADRTQYTELQTKVPDYDQIADQVSAWVDRQPAYLQPGYRYVIDQGTSSEVIDLIDRFRRDTGSVTPAQQQLQGGGRAPVAPQTKPATELSPAARQAAARLAPISSKRTNATTASPTDFDSAFAQFASTV